MSRTRNVPTLDDVARESGVSTATVSRCLNDPDKVNGATRERIMAAVEALGYTPNFAARVMAAQRSFTIGAIIPTMENAIFARGIQAFQEELSSLRYNLLVSSSAYDPAVEVEQIRSLVARGADGLMLIGHERDSSIYDYLERQNVPALAAWSYISGGKIPSIGFDNQAAMRLLIEEVIKDGHTKLAMISGITQGNDRARLRMAGMMEAAQAHGINPDSIPVLETPYGVENGTAAFLKLVSQPNRPSIVICGNDVLAVGAILGAQQLGMNVPRDISVTGFDDIELAEIVRPALTTVHVPHRKMGRAAAREIVAMVERESSGQSKILETSIARRSSLGRIPA